MSKRHGVHSGMIYTDDEGVTWRVLNRAGGDRWNVVRVRYDDHQKPGRKWVSVPGAVSIERTYVINGLREHAGAEARRAEMLAGWDPTP